MGDVLQLVELGIEGDIKVVADLNRLTADRGYYLERDTLQIAPGARERRMAQLTGRYGGQAQLGEVRDNATLAATFAVKGGAYGTVESDKVMADAEALTACLDSPSAVFTSYGSGPRYLMFRPEFASGRRRTFYRLQGAADWRPRYIRNAFTGGNVMALELTAPIAPRAFGAPLDVRERFDDGLVAYADQWTQVGGTLPFSDAGGGIRLAGGDTASRVMAIQDRRGEPVADREIAVKFQWDGGDDAVVRGIGTVVKWKDANNWLAVVHRNRATLADTFWLMACVGGVVTTSEVATGATLGAASDAWLRVRTQQDAFWVDFYVQDPEPTVASSPVASYSSTLTAVFGSTIAAALGDGVAGFGGIIFERPTSSNWKALDYIDRPYTYRSLTLPSDGAHATLGAVPGTAPAEAEVEIYPRVGNRPRYGLIAWNKVSDAPAGGPASFGTRNQTGVAGLGATYSAGNANRTALSSAGGVGSGFVDCDFSLWQADPFAGPFVPVAVFARVAVPSTAVTPRIAVFAQPDPANAITKVYAVDTGTLGRPLPIPSSGTPLRFLPLGVVMADTRMWQASQRVGWEISYGPGSSGNIDVDYLLIVPARHMASSPVGKSSAGYPDLFEVSGRTKRIAPDLSARYKPADSNDRFYLPSSGLGGAALELEPGANQFYVKTSDLIPDDPAASASSEELYQTLDVHWAIRPAYRLWSDA